MQSKLVSTLISPKAYHCLWHLWIALILHPLLPLLCIHFCIAQSHKSPRFFFHSTSPVTNGRDTNEWMMLLMMNENLKAIFVFNQRLGNIFTVKRQIWLRHQIKGLISCEAYRRADPFPSTVLLIWAWYKKRVMDGVKLYRTHTNGVHRCSAHVHGRRICFYARFPVIDNNPNIF